MSYYYDADEVKSYIGDSWVQVLSSLAPELQSAISRFGRHTACPIHGGKDGFRLFKDATRTGGGICNTCGPRNDGFELLMWLKGWDFNHTLLEVGDLVGAPRHPKKSQIESFVQPGNSQKNLNQDNLSANNQDTQKKSRYRARGNVIGFGSAPYRFDKDNDHSYYISVRSKSGKETTTWGVDLERAVSESKVQVGDYVTVMALGKEYVTILQPVVNSDGEVIEEIEKQVYRTSFTIDCKNQVADKRVHKQPLEEDTKKVANTSSWNENKRSSKDDTLKFKPNKKGWANHEALAVIDRASSSSLNTVKASAKVTALWEECLALTSHKAKPAHQYFLNRGFAATLDSVALHDSVRFHPNLEYYEEDKDGKFKCKGKYPAIVTAIRNIDGDLITLHRIYLSAQGKKAKVSSPKKMMPVPDGLSVTASAIQTVESSDGVLGVTEGLETALAVYRATGLPTWSTINAQIMKSFTPPKDIHTVIVWADLDRSNTGESAAMALKTRLAKEGVKVLIALPQCSIPKKSKSVDWNDVLIEKGRLGFPNVLRLRKLLGVA